MDSQDPHQIVNPASARYTDRGSRFLSHAHPVTCDVNIEELLSKIAKKYPDATHLCYAWRMDPDRNREFFQDDGEPSGTAGLPILGVLRTHSLFQTLLTVTRYYGGTKLGRPGLINAYREAARMAIDNSVRIPLQLCRIVRVEYPYKLENDLRELITRFHITIHEESYLEKVRLKLSCRNEMEPVFCSLLQQLKHKGLDYEKLDTQYLPKKK